LRIVNQSLRYSFIPENAPATNWQGIIDIIISTSGKKSCVLAMSSIFLGSFTHSKKNG
jgi:hypothetical protein